MIYENIFSQKKLDIDQILFLYIYDYEEEPDSAQAVRKGDFWELLYVEKGLINIDTSSSVYTLSKMELFFRSPAETFHLHMLTSVPAKLISIGFTCKMSDTASSIISDITPHFASEISVPTSVMDFFRNKILPIGSAERRLLGHIVAEATACHDTAPFAAGQLALLYLQLLLILLIRNGNADITLASVPHSQRLMNEECLFHDIIAYMEKNIAEHLTIERICRDNLVGRALLQKLFSNYTGCGIIDYFSLMKINAAKQLIRKGTLSFSQIAEQLGYNSIHYFSRQFKTITGVTPSVYAAGLAEVSHNEVETP